MKKCFVSFISILLLVTLSCNRTDYKITDEVFIDRSAPHAEGNVELRADPNGGFKVKTHISQEKGIEATMGIAMGNSIMIDGLTHTWIGKCKYENYVFNGDLDDPLVFKVDKDKGDTYVKGKGTVTNPYGNSVMLP
jgi:hypothetical protein